jgi:hypothetical protein
MQPGAHTLKRKSNTRERTHGVRTSKKPARSVQEAPESTLKTSSRDEVTTCFQNQKLAATLPGSTQIILDQITNMPEAAFLDAVLIDGVPGDKDEEQPARRPFTNRP